MRPIHKPQPWLVFTLVAIAQFMVVLDISITNVALPSIKTALHFGGNSALQWVITVYALTFGGFLLLGGRAADLFGRRRTLLIGMACFTTFSLAIGFSQSATMLIVLRGLQGLAAALMSPAALSIVLATFEEGSERNSALGLWSTVATGGAAIGLLFGGVLTQYFGWQWNFFVNVPIGIAVMLAIWYIVPPYESQAGHSHLDLPGAVLSTGGLMLIVYAISQAPTAGWLSPVTLGLIVLAFIVLGAFVYNESRSAHPLVPLAIFGTGNVTGANLIMAALYACLLGIFFLMTLYMQNVLHYSPVETGFAFLPFPLVLGFFSWRVPRWVGRVGYKPFLLIGPVLVALGLAWLVRLPVHGSYFFDMLPALLVVPAGVGINFMPAVASATSGVAQDKSGLASGLITTSQQMGGAVGLAVFTGIASTAASGGEGSAQMLVAGFDKSFGAAIIFMVLTFLIALFLIKEKPRKPDGTYAASVR